MIYDSEDIKKIIKKNYKEYVKFQYPLSFQILYIWQNSLAKDLDTSLILSYLSIQALKTYNRNNKKNSFKDLIKNKEINIGKVKKAEISRELKIPRETVRRKLEELNKKKLIFMYDGSIIKKTEEAVELNVSDITKKTIYSEKPEELASVYIRASEKDGNIRKLYSDEEIEKFIKKQEKKNVKLRKKLDKIKKKEAKKKAKKLKISKLN